MYETLLLAEEQRTTAEGREARSDTLLAETNSQARRPADRRPRPQPRPPPHPAPSPSTPSTPSTLLPSQVKRLQRRLDEVSSQLLTAREGRATATLEIALLGDRKVTRTLALTQP